MKSVLVALASVVALGCGGDLCAKAQECNQKAGTVFSITECRQSQSIAREQAQSKNCVAQYDALTACAVGLNCGATEADLATNCGSKINDFNRCAQ